MRSACLLLCLGLIGCGADPNPPDDRADRRIRPSADHPFYWEFGDEPLLLLGGSGDDNLFQWPDDQLREQLDLLVSVGGNYVRNTMSDRPDKGFEQYAYDYTPEAKFDLDKWNPEYWRRFERFLDWTEQRGVIVQIEVWDRFDFTDNNDAERWQRHPLNPRNNINYDYAESGYAESYPDHPGRNLQPFFFSTPAQRNNLIVLERQQQFVDKMLSYSLSRGNVLYCMDNETKAEPAWGAYWASFIRNKATAAGAEIYLTEMWDAWDLKSEEHRNTFDHPELYDFVDVSQNNHNKGDTHWENFLTVRSELGSQPRPMNTVKTYGADGNKFGHDDDDGVERFVRHLLAGAASVRFHRPPSGLGLNSKAQAAIRAARALEQLVPLWALEPAAEPPGDRADGGAYAAVGADGTTVVYLTPKQAEVPLTISVEPGPYELLWIDVSTGEADQSVEISAGQSVKLQALGAGHWLAVLRPLRP